MRLCTEVFIFADWKILHRKSTKSDDDDDQMMMKKIEREEELQKKYLNYKW